MVVLTASAADHVLVAAIEAGSSGFLSKSRGLEEVRAAVRAAPVGESVISPEMLARLMSRFHRGRENPATELTEREREVLSLVAEGLSNAAIAERLVVSVHTIRNHIASLSANSGRTPSWRPCRSPYTRACSPTCDIVGQPAGRVFRR